MKIQRATFLGLRGVPDGSYRFASGSGSPSDLVVVTGGAGSGKTRLLEALVAAKEAIAPYGSLLVGGPWIARGDNVAKATLTFHLDAEEQAYACLMQEQVDAEAQFQEHRVAWSADDGLHAVLARYEHGRKTGKLEYFPASRGLPPHGPFAATDAASQGRLRAASDPRKYAFLGTFLREIAAAPARSAAVAARLAALSPTCRLVPHVGDGELPRCFSSRGGPAVTWAELADGERDAIVLAATAVAIDLHASLVFVDRPELHVAPEDAAATLAGLRALGDGNQLFLATQSPAFLEAAAGAVVIDLDRPSRAWAPGREQQQEAANA